MGMVAKDARHLRAVQKQSNQLEKKKVSFGSLGERSDRTPYGTVRRGSTGVVRAKK